MGRVAGWIDGIALGLIAYGAAFLYFFHTTGGAVAGALLAVLPATLLSWAYRRWVLRRYRRRVRARQARGMVEHLARLPEEAARAQAARFAGFAGVLLQRHPKGRPLTRTRCSRSGAARKAIPGNRDHRRGVRRAWQAAEELTAPGVCCWTAASSPTGTNEAV
jgi:hypothetical protein